MHRSTMNLHKSRLLHNNPRLLSLYLVSIDMFDLQRSSYLDGQLMRNSKFQLDTGILVYQTQIEVGLGSVCIVKGYFVRYCCSDLHVARMVAGPFPRWYYWPRMKILPRCCRIAAQDSHLRQCPRFPSAQMSSIRGKISLPRHPSSSSPPLLDVVPACAVCSHLF
jgi:hypothetical protein